MNDKLFNGVAMHLIKNRLTYNAEVDPVVIRPVDINVLIPCIVDYLTQEGYINTEKVS